MWIVFKKDDLTIVGLTPCYGIDGDKKKNIEEIVNGTANPLDISAYDAIEITDEKKCNTYFRAFPNKLKIVGTADAPKVTIRDPEYFSIHISTDAPDKHPVDGIPEIVADGKSFTTITLEKVDERKKLMTAKTDNDLLYLRTDCGTLQDNAGKGAINTVKLSSGKAKIRLVSDAMKRVATIQVLSAEKNIYGCTAQVEFI